MDARTLIFANVLSIISMMLMFGLFPKRSLDTFVCIRLFADSSSVSLQSAPR